MIQSMLIEEITDGCMADDGWNIIFGIVLEAVFNFTWSPASLPAKLKDQLNSLLRSLPAGLRNLRFDD